MATSAENLSLALRIFLKQRHCGFFFRIETTMGSPSTGCPKKVPAFDQQWNKTLSFDFQNFFSLE